MNIFNYMPCVIIGFIAGTLWAYFDGTLGESNHRNKLEKNI